MIGDYDTYVNKTDINGVATLQLPYRNTPPGYAPFGVPDSSLASAAYSFRAIFFG